MSNYLAIATVTETLRRMLDDYVSSDVPGSTATSVRPTESGTGLPDTGVNIYLYQVAKSPGRTNIDLTTRRQDGTLIQKPRVALDLNYILTFFGDEGDLNPQKVMGSVVRTLHVQPRLIRQQIYESIEASSFLNGDESPFVRSDLDEEVEHLSLTPMNLTVDELQSLWYGFFQAPYHLSLAYKASAVVIDGEVTPKTALPVAGRNVYGRTFVQPVVDRVLSLDGENSPILATSVLLIKGKNLAGNVTRVRIGAEEFTPSEVKDREIRMAVPGSLRSGLHSLQVVHKTMMGSPPVLHSGQESNVAAFVLRPDIKAPVPLDLTPVTMKLLLSPEVGRRQRVVLLLNEMKVNSPKAYALDAAPRDLDQDTVEFDISEVESSAYGYLVRVQVDGAESVLGVDSNTGQYDSPAVYI